MAGSKSEVDVLRSIDTKLSALLAIALDDYVRTHGVEGARPRQVGVMLHGAGLSTAEVADLLGKGQRAVQIAVKETPRKTAKKTTKKTGKKAAKRTAKKTGRKKSR